MKGQIVIESYDKATGKSRVKIATKWGTFDHTVECAPEDKDVENRFDGIRFAHRLCYIDYLRAKARAFEQRAIGISHAANILYGVATDEKTQWKVNGDAVMDCRIQAEIAADEARVMREEANKLERDYPAFVGATLDTRRQLRAKHKEENE